MSSSAPVRPATEQMYRALLGVMRELATGPAPEGAFVLNPGDRGLLSSLDTLSADSASRTAGEASIAAHVDHLAYGLSLMNRWSRGESPFADANYAASWRRIKVSEHEWRELRKRLRTEIERWSEAIPRLQDLSEADLAGVIASVVHLAYHVGAMRQMNQGLRGPRAHD